MDAAFVLQHSNKPKRDACSSIALGDRHFSTTIFENLRSRGKTPLLTPTFQERAHPESYAMSVSDEDVLHHLRYDEIEDDIESDDERYYEIPNKVIRINKSAKPAFTAIRHGHALALGRLGKLPLELIHECLGHLDIQSLWQLFRVCCGGHAVVKTLSGLKKLVQHCNYLFKVLVQTQTLGIHSLNTLVSVLESERCVSCGAFGAFLLVLTAERCCSACLHANQSLWLTSLSLAKRAFGLTDEQLKELPTMRRVPAKIYWVNGISSGSIADYDVEEPWLLLTSVRAAKEKAITVYGSIEALESEQPLVYGGLDDYRDYYVAIRHRKAPLAPLSQDPLMTVFFRKDPFAGMGAVPFPSLVNGGVDHGTRCLGCKTQCFTYRRILRSSSRNLTVEEWRGTFGLNAHEWASLVPEGCDIAKYLYRMQFRVWSKAGLVQHVRNCPWVKRMLARRAALNLQQ